MNHRLLPLLGALTAAGCASLPVDSTRARSSVANPEAPPGPPWTPQPLSSAAPATTESAPSRTAPAAKAYVCPMHPEVQGDGPGDCSKCGMPLKRRPDGDSTDGDSK
jgi:hypothetical protein